MSRTTPERTPESLQREIEQLRRQLAEAQETIRAIRSGEVDAVVVDAAEEPKVFTLDAVDRPYRLLVEQIEEAAAMLTVEGCILAHNEAFARLLGCVDEDLNGRMLEDFVAAPALNDLKALMKRGLGARVEGEIALRRRDGGTTQVCVEIRALHEGVAGTCLVLTDITEQKRHERLVADEALARSILEQIADAVVVADRTGVVLRASRAAHTLSGTNPIGRRFEDVFRLTLLSEGDSGRPVDMRPAWRGETIRGWEVEFARRDGQRAELLVGAGPLVTAEGKVLGSVVTLTDITALRAAKTELRRRAAELQEADRRKDEFLATLAHELRNPLSPIRSALEIMQLKELHDPYLRKCHEVIGRQVQQLTRLVDDLLEVSRIRSGKIQLHKERIDLATAVARAVETTRPIVDARRHRLIVSVPGTPVWIHADLMRLSQVISNLIHNA
ncbi:MAG TPA: PAS domain S-box protein, partial [Nannocystis sp.]